MKAPVPPIDLEYVRRIVDGVDGSPFAEPEPDEEALRIELGQERFRADQEHDRAAYALHLLARTSLKLGQSRGALETTQKRVEAIAGERDRAKRRATWWMLAAWAMFLLSVVAITWRLR